MLFWGGVFAGLMILCVIVAQERGNTWAALRAIGRPGVVAAIHHHWLRVALVRR
jgi:hypothetical protein